MGFPVSGLMICRIIFRPHSGTRGEISYLLRVEVLLAVLSLLKQFASTVTKKLVVGYLELEGPAVPLVVEVDVVRMDEGEFLIYRASDPEMLLNRAMAAYSGLWQQERSADH